MLDLDQHIHWRPGQWMLHHCVALFLLLLVFLCVCAFVLENSGGEGILPLPPGYSLLTVIFLGVLGSHHIRGWCSLPFSQSHLNSLLTPRVDMNNKPHSSLCGSISPDTFNNWNSLNPHARLLSDKHWISPVKTRNGIWISQSPAVECVNTMSTMFGLLKWPKEWPCSRPPSTFENRKSPAGKSQVTPLARMPVTTGIWLVAYSTHRWTSCLHSEREKVDLIFGGDSPSLWPLQPMANASKFTDNYELPASHLSSFYLAEQASSSCCRGDGR